MQTFDYEGVGTSKSTPIQVLFKVNYILIYITIAFLENSVYIKSSKKNQTSCWYIKSNYILGSDNYEGGSHLCEWLIEHSVVVQCSKYMGRLYVYETVPERAG